MRAPPQHLTDSEVAAAAASGWGLRPSAVEYLPEGGGSFHWALVDRGRGTLFVRVDDLDDKPWIGDQRAVVLDGLRRAFATAILLQRDAGLSFVVAPLPSVTGDALQPLGERYAVSVFPYLEGTSFAFGPYAGPRLRAAVLDLLAALHGATPVVEADAPAHVPSVPWRSAVDAFIAEPRHPWAGGPFSAASHELFLTYAADLAEVLRGFDRLVAATAGRRATNVVTHGEPHPGNVMMVGGQPVLLDWDTVALGPPERDLWLVAAGDDDERRYSNATERTVDEATMTLYRLRWYLDDLASALHLFSGPHTADADSARWWDGLAPRVAELASWREAVAER